MRKSNIEAVRAAAHGGPRLTQHLPHIFLFAPTHNLFVRAGHPAGPPIEFRKIYRYNLVGAASPGGPPNSRKSSPNRRTGRRPRRPVPVNIRAVNQRWTGRPGGRPLRNRCTKWPSNLLISAYDGLPRTLSPNFSPPPTRRGAPFGAPRSVSLSLSGRLTGPCNQGTWRRRRRSPRGWWCPQGPAYGWACHR